MEDTATDGAPTLRLRKTPRNKDGNFNKSASKIEQLKFLIL
jgi:hypothetical protein